MVFYYQLKNCFANNLTKEVSNWFVTLVHSVQKSQQRELLSTQKYSLLTGNLATAFSDHTFHREKSSLSRRLATVSVPYGCLYSLDWTTGLDYWTDLFATKNHFYAL